MQASAFDEENAVLDPPPGVSMDEVYALSVFRGLTEDGKPVVISCWKPTREEWEEMKATGRVWLILHGHTMQPAAVSGHYPFAKPEETA